MAYISSNDANIILDILSRKEFSVFDTSEFKKKNIYQNQDRITPKFKLSKLMI